MSENVQVCRWPNQPNKERSPFHDWLISKLEQTKSKEKFLVDGLTGMGFTHQEVVTRSKQVASGLQRHGLRKGDILLMFSPNDVHYAMAFLGTAINGATFSMASHRYNARELLHQLTDSGASMIICHEVVSSVAKEACQLHGGIKEIFVIGNSEGCVPFQELMDDSGACYPDKITVNVDDDVCILPYSSGTTGLPKGVMVTHNSLVNCIISGSHPMKFNLQPDDTFVVLMPMYHIYGFLMMAMSFSNHLRAVLLPRFEPEPFLKALDAYKVNVLPMSPPIALYMTQHKNTANYDLTNIRTVVCASAPLAPDVKMGFLKKFPEVQEFKQAYGMTETTFGTHIQHTGGEFKTGSVGSLTPFCEAKITDPSSNRALGPNEEGELCLRGVGIMKGYQNKPEATSETIDQDGWLHTGDIAYYDEDGDFFIVDRIKELIKHWGLHVAPAELEALLLTHNSIKDAAVVGVPDKAAGESARAYVIKQPNSDVTEQEIKDFVAARLSRHKHLHAGVVFVEEIPKSPSGKILRRELRKKIKEEFQQN